MVGQERISQGVQIQQSMFSNDEKLTPSKFSKYIPKWFTGKLLSFLIALTMFITLLNVKIFDKGEENCLALLVFCVILWSTEVSVS